MAQLDRTREFAVIYGTADDNARYVQDGKRFAGSGEEIGASEDSAEQKPEKLLTKAEQKRLEKEAAAAEAEAAAAEAAAAEAAAAEAAAAEAATSADSQELA